MIRLDSVITRVNTKEDKDNTILLYYVGGEHIDSQELAITKKGIIRGSTIGPMFYCGFKKGDVLFVSRNPHLKKAAKVDFDGICSEKTFVLGTKDESVLLQDYIPIILQTDAFWQYCEDNKSGGVNYFINWSTLAAYEFELPTIEEQKEIADKVWAAYRLKESYKKMIESTDEMVKSRFIEMFGDPQSPIGNTKKGSELFRFSSGSAMTKTNLSDEYMYPCFGGNGITGMSQSYLIDYPTYVLGRVGEYCGCVHVVPARSWITDNAIFIKEFLTDDYDFNYLYYLLKFIDFHRMAKETGQPKITQEPLLNYSFIIPDKNRQVLFSSLAKQADKSKFELREAIKRVESMMKSLMN